MLRHDNGAWIEVPLGKAPNPKIPPPPLLWSVTGYMQRTNFASHVTIYVTNNPFH